MARVLLTRALAREADGELRHTVAAATVREALDGLLARHPRLRRYLLDDQGAPRQHVNVFVNDALVLDRRGLSDPVTPADEIHILPAVSGGAR